MKNSDDNDIQLIIWGVILTLGLYLIIPSILILIFQDGIGWVVSGLFTLSVGCLVVIFIIAGLGTLNKRLGKYEILLLFLSDAVILMILGIISMFTSLILIGVIRVLSSYIGITFMLGFIKENNSMTTIFLTFFIQLWVYIKSNEFFKEKLIKKLFKIKDADIDFLKFYHSTFINKVYMIASFVITVVLLGLSADYSNNDESLKTTFFEGPYFLFLIAISIYVMNAYLVWVAPNKKPLIGIDILTEKQEGE